jgi:hypothetical protein
MRMLLVDYLTKLHMHLPRVRIFSALLFVIITNGTREKKRYKKGDKIGHRKYIFFFFNDPIYI